MSNQAVADARNVRLAPVNTAVRVASIQWQGGSVQSVPQVNPQPGSVVIRVSMAYTPDPNAYLLGAWVQDENSRIISGAYSAGFLRAANYAGGNPMTISFSVKDEPLNNHTYTLVVQEAGATGSGGEVSYALIEIG